jgi:hypothetical protein
MDWKQIETKWTAMTRRVRGDCATDTAGTQTPSARKVIRADLSAAPLAERMTNVVMNARPKTPVE